MLRVLPRGSHLPAQLPPAQQRGGSGGDMGPGSALAAEALPGQGWQDKTYRRVRFSARLRGTVSSMWLRWLGERLSSSFTSRFRFPGGARGSGHGQGMPILNPERGQCQHRLPRSRQTLTFQRGPGGVGLQVVLPHTGPCGAAELLQGWAAAPAPQPGGAVVVLGDDRPTAAPCRREQGRRVGAPAEQGGWESSAEGLLGLGKGGWYPPMVRLGMLARIRRVVEE